jgi:serine/threonine protein kinase
MGVVYKAQDTKLNRTVALKFLSVDLTRDQEAIGRFINEAQAASALDHTNICTIYEIGETEEAQLFIVMAYYAGETLQEKIKRGPLPVEEAIDIATQAAQGLERAYEAGIVHRDIKPSNLIITPRGEVKIIDFGLAKLAGQTRLTKTGATVGTVAYMSPEQIQLVDMDHRTDLWALGVVLYEMLSGKLPFRGDHEAAMIYSIISEKPEPIRKYCPDLSPEFVHVLNRALEKNPADRYQSVSDLLIDLRRLQEIQNKSELPLCELDRGKLKNIGAPMNVYGLVLPWQKKLLPFFERLDFTSKRRKANFYRLAAMFGSMAALLWRLFLWEKTGNAGSELHRIAVLPLANISPIRRTNTSPRG